jgi:MoaA/NifB/PqqE/SkfB family radical SAM enzyme
MLQNHRRTLRYLWVKDKKSFYNHIFTTYFIRGEDCGKGVLDPVWKLTGRSPFLWDLEMEVTTACYLKCIHCEHTYFDKSYLNQHLSLETFKKVLDNIPNLHWINLTGEGTAILNPDFTEMVKEVKRRGIYLDFSHDFVKLDTFLALRWIMCGVDRIYWSFDGCTKETYEKIRLGANFDKVCENIKIFVELKKRMKSPIPEICFRFAFFKDNINEVTMIPSFLYNLVDGNVKDYGDEPSINIVALLEFKETKGWEREIPNAIIQKVNKECKELGFKVYWSHTTHIEEEKPPLDYCTFWSEPYIMITGHVVPCCAVLMSNNRPNLERMAFGNINEQTLKDIWNNPYYKSFRKQVVNPHTAVPEVCMGCRVFNTKTRAKKYGVR